MYFPDFPLKRKNLARALLKFVLAAFFVSTPAVSAALGNILVIVADDLGIDMLERYSIASTSPATPNIDALADQGILFRNAWSNPVCSPTRATIQTGRYSVRTGVGFVVRTGLTDPNYTNLLDIEEKSVAELLGAHGYATAAIGKWHLSTMLKYGEDSPVQHGYSYYAGAFANLNLESYSSWTRIESQRLSDGEISTSSGVTNGYATRVNVNDAMNWISQRATGEPWFMWLAFNAPHSPFHTPVRKATGSPGCETGNEATCYEAQTCSTSSFFPCYRDMVEVMDAEIGRLLASLPPEVQTNTTVIFLGDNGTPKDVTQPPFDPNRAKGTLFEGGIRVPLIISPASGNSTPRDYRGLVNTTDLFATILDIAGIDIQSESALNNVKLDSISLKPIINGQSHAVRKYSYAELFNGNTSFPDGKTIRNMRYKLIQWHPLFSPPEAFYRLGENNLTETGLSLSNLSPEELTELNQLRVQINAVESGTDHWQLLAPIPGLSPALQLLTE